MNGDMFSAFQRNVEERFLHTDERHDSRPWLEVPEHSSEPAGTQEPSNVHLK
jgi:hypothetical protein